MSTPDDTERQLRDITRWTERDALDDLAELYPHARRRVLDADDDDLEPAPLRFDEKDDDDGR